MNSSYEFLLLGAHLRDNCVDLPAIAQCDYFLSGTVEEQHTLMDQSANIYLKDVLQKCSKFGANFVPIKVEGDGNCLVHSISRSIGITEHLYSVLRAALTTELIDNEAFYQRVTGGAYNHDGDGSFKKQIEDARPTSRGVKWMTPLHIFGLANVLKRPIILLDGEMNPLPGQHGRGIYLPSRYSPEECYLEGSMPSPIIISWASAELNHYVCLTHLMGEVNQEQPIGKSTLCQCENCKKNKNTGAKTKIQNAGCVRACRTLRSIVPVAKRISALQGEYLSEGASIAYMEKHCSLTFLFLLPHFKPVSLSLSRILLYSKNTQTSLFFNPIIYF